MFMHKVFLTTKVSYTLFLPEKESEDDLMYLSLLLNQVGYTGDFLP